MAMEQFDILGALETAALAKGWKFVYGIDSAYNNAAAAQQYDNGDLVLIADYRVVPTYSGVKYAQISYTCLLMLGRKFDTDGQAATLDEDFEQKYTRRLKLLVNSLADFIGTFKCDNELTVTPPSITPAINVFDTNIDFAIANSVIFNQE